jgi:hypothetical protein
VLSFSFVFPHQVGIQSATVAPGCHLSFWRGKRRGPIAAITALPYEIAPRDSAAVFGNAIDLAARIGAS